MKKIDKTLKEARHLKQKVSAKTRRMTPEQVVSYFRAAKIDLENMSRKYRAA